jgi:tetratricopeptide (TPR) repeat protein
VLAVQARADRERAAVATERATRRAATDASIAAAIREARERADEAWGVTDYPDRIQRATDAAVGAVRRADEFAEGGLPGEATRVELESTRRAVDDLARHTRLIVAISDSGRRFADGRGGMDWKAQAALCRRFREALQQFGLDPIDGPADEVARAIASSRIRDALLGVLLEWKMHATLLAESLRRYPGRSDLPADAPVLADRLGRVTRSARQLSGGAYARWQELLDRHDVPGLVAFADSPDGLVFRSTLVGGLERDLAQAGAALARRAYLRAAVDRYPDDPWLHHNLALACRGVKPPAHAEALRHFSAASALLPDSAWFHLKLGDQYAELGAYDQAIAAYRKVMSMSSSAVYAVDAQRRMSEALLKKRDWEGAIAAFRELIRLPPEGLAKIHLLSAYVNLGAALVAAGRPAEADDASREALRLKLVPDEPSWLASFGPALAIVGLPAEALRRTRASLGLNPALAEDPRNYLRYNVACFALNCADCKGTDVPAPSERPAYRAQALDLLTTELAAIQKLTASDRAFVHMRMQWWLKDPDLASVRGPAGVDGLPPDEREAWRKLWAEIRELRDSSAPQPDPRRMSK